MKGLILTGGTGSRLRPLTYTMPKQMIPIANKPVLEYAVADLVEAGISEVGFVLGNHGQEEIKEYFRNGSEFGIDITYIYQGEPLGLAHAVGCAKDFVAEEPFVLYLGDDMIQKGVTKLVEGFDEEKHSGSVAIQPVDEPSRYGIVNVDDNGEVIGLIEKPNDPPTSLAGIGIFVLTPAIFEEIENISRSWRGELELSDAVHSLIQSGHRFQTHVMDGWWRDVGTPEDVLEANRLVLDDLEPDNQGEVAEGAEVMGRIDLGDGSVIEAGAVVRGPVSIGENVRITADTYVGAYTTIGDGCTLEGASVESSVVLSGTEISSDQLLTDSLIGKDTTITDSDGPKPGKELLIGTDSQVGL